MLINNKKKWENKIFSCGNRKCGKGEALAAPQNGRTNPNQASKKSILKGNWLFACFVQKALLDDWQQGTIGNMKNLQ